MPFTDDEELLTEREVGQHIHRSTRQLQRDRAARRGIPFVQLENQIRYRRGDVRAYIARNLVGSTTEQRAKDIAIAACAASPRHKRGGPRKPKRHECAP